MVAVPASFGQTAPSAETPVVMTPVVAIETSEDAGFGTAASAAPKRVVHTGSKHRPVTVVAEMTACISTAPLEDYCR